MAGAWMCPMSCRPISGPSSGRRCAAPTPTPGSWGRSGGTASPWLQGDSFDGVMNYPLAWSLLGYFGAATVLRELKLAPLPEPPYQPLDRPAFQQRVERELGRYSEAVTRCQLNLLDSHDTPRALHALGRRRRGPAAGPAVPVPAARRPLRLLRHRDGAGWRSGAGLPGSLPLGQGPRRSCRDGCGNWPPCGGACPALRSNPLSFREQRPRRSAAAVAGQRLRSALGGDQPGRCFPAAPATGPPWSAAVVEHGERGGSLAPAPSTLLPGRAAVILAAPEA